MLGMMLGVALRSQTSAAAAVAGSGWNSSDAGAGYAFTGTNNSIATRNGADGSPRNVRGTQGRSAGRLYLEVALTDLAFGNTDARVGIGNASAALSSFEGGANVAIFNLSGDLGGNSTTLGTFSAKGDGTIFGLTIDFSSKLLFIQDNTGPLLGGDPDGAGAGISLAYLLPGTLFPFLQTTTIGDFSPLNTTSFALTKPTSATAWG